MRRGKKTLFYSGKGTTQQIAIKARIFLSDMGISLTFVPDMRTIPLIFSDIAGSEILLILFFILIFFGSKAIPGIAQSLGKTIRQIKDASNDVQNEIRKSAGDVKTDFNLQRMINETKEDIEEPFREHAQTLDQAMNFEPPRTFVRSVEKPSIGSQPTESSTTTAKDQEVVENDAESATEDQEQKK